MFSFQKENNGTRLMEKTVLLIDLKTQQTSQVPLSYAAKIAQLDETEVLWALEEFGQCETDLHLIVESTEGAEHSSMAVSTETCFLLQSDSRQIGHFRCLGNAQAIAATLSTSLITELHLAAPIVCDDDPLH